MKILLNGQEKPMSDAATIDDLICSLGLQQRRIAVEVNQEIVPRSLHKDYVIKDADRVEVVSAIGGG